MGPSRSTMNRKACVTSLYRCGLRYTYARAVSMGCITATDAAADRMPEMPPNTGEPGDKMRLDTSASAAMLCTVRFTLDPSMSRVTDAPTPLYKVFHPSFFTMVSMAFFKLVYAHISAGTCMRVLMRSKGLELTAPSAPVMVPAMKRFHAGAGVSSLCRHFSTGPNSPMRNMFLLLSRTIATGSPRYNPGISPSFLHTYCSASTMFLPYFLPGSCVSVLARSMGLVNSTAIQLAAPAFGMDAHAGSLIFSSWPSKEPLGALRPASGGATFRGLLCCAPLVAAGASSFVATATPAFLPISLLPHHSQQTRQERQPPKSARFTLQLPRAPH
mmetsp:Transcript_196/g.450  ORF Transcript_196/g.450 Transcript_196/m.450 type:complete len:329 (+) Transcript_196:351-1337(+)